MLIDGIHVPLTTPFYRDGRSYLRKLEHNTGRYSLSPAAGLVALPPGGEGSGLLDAEVLDTLEAVAGFAKPEKVLVAGVQRESVAGAMWLAEAAAGAGFDAVLVSAPGSKLQAAEVGVYFRAVADASPLPVLLSSDGYALSVDMVGELSAHANIIGLYDAGLTLERYSAIVEATRGAKREVSVTTVFAPVTRRMKAPAASGPATFVSAESLGGASGGGAALAVAEPVAAVKMRTKTVGFQVMAAGRAAGLVELLEAGVAGALLELSASAPQACHEVYAAFKDGNPGLAAEKAQRLAKADALVAELGVAAVKYGCDLNGYYGGAPRLPRLPLTGADRERVERVFAGLKS